MSEWEAKRQIRAQPNLLGPLDLGVLDLSVVPLSQGEIKESKLTECFISVPCELTFHVTQQGEISFRGIVSKWECNGSARNIVIKEDVTESRQGDLDVL